MEGLTKQFFADRKQFKYILNKLTEVLFDETVLHDVHCLTYVKWQGNMGIRVLENELTYFRYDDVF